MWKIDLSSVKYTWIPFRLIESPIRPALSINRCSSNPCSRILLSRFSVFPTPANVSKSIRDDTRASENWSRNWGRPRAVSLIAAKPSSDAPPAARFWEMKLLFNIVVFYHLCNIKSVPYICHSLLHPCKNRYELRPLRDGGLRNLDALETKKLYFWLIAAWKIINH